MIIDKCKSFEVQKIIIPGLIFNRKVERSILKQVNYELQQLCVKNGYHFIDNSNISNTVQMIDLLDRQCLKRKGFPIKTNHINSEKKVILMIVSTFLLKINNQIMS